MSGFSNPIIGGGGALVYPAIKSPNFVTGSAGWQIAKTGSAEFNNAIIRNGQVISGTSLFYNGTPALGNLYVSISAAAGTDSFGNAYNAGVWSYTAAASIGEQGATQHTFLGVAGLQSHDTSYASDGLLIFFTAAGGGGQPSAILESPNNSAGNSSVLVLAGRSQDGTKAAYTVLGQFDGANIQAEDVIVVGRLGFGTAGQSASAQVLKQFFSVVNGVINVQEASGQSGAVPATGGDTTVRTVTQTAATQLTGSMPIAANDPNVNTTYRLKASGSGVQGSTAQALTIQLNTPSSGALDAINVPAASLPLNTAFRWELEAEYSAAAIGAAGTPVHKLRFTLMSTGSAGTPIEDIRRGSNAGAWNTTIAGALRADAFWGSATGAPTISCERSSFERIGP